VPVIFRASFCDSEKQNGPYEKILYAA
jgi:hypothetical protein